MKPMLSILLLVVPPSLVQFACDSSPPYASAAAEIDSPPYASAAAEIEAMQKAERERFARPCRAIEVNGTPCIFCMDVGYRNQSMALSCNWSTDGGRP